MKLPVLYPSPVYPISQFLLKPDYSNIQIIEQTIKESEIVLPPEPEVILPLTEAEIFEFQKQLANEPANDHKRKRFSTKTTVQKSTFDYSKYELEVKADQEWQSMLKEMEEDTKRKVHQQVKTLLDTYDWLYSTK